MKNWQNRLADMKNIIMTRINPSETGTCYPLVDFKIDSEMITAMANDESEFVWLLRSNGSELINLRMPRSRHTLEQIIYACNFDKCYLVTEYKLAEVSKQHALDMSCQIKKYTVSDGNVYRPDGTLLANYDLKRVPEKFGFYEATIRMENYQFGIRSSKMPNLKENELFLIERSIADELISMTGTMFSRLHSTYYQVTDSIKLKSEEFDEFIKDDGDFIFIESIKGMDVFLSALLPTKDLEKAKEFLQPFKLKAEIHFGDLQGVKLKFICNKTSAASWDAFELV